LEPYLDARYQDAEDGDEYVLPMTRRMVPGAFRSGLMRAQRRLKMDRWPRVFHNMRSTRQTELEEIFPSHVVCAWLGNSEAVARKHYLQVTESHYEQAAKIPARIPAQHTAEPGRMSPQQ
ncbi:MAG: hypothetical protein H0T51_05340, partial [Pirellulales bacterium]|nr:hypothetical protein [Pirellulales bacterium]